MADKSAGLGSITNQMGEGLRNLPVLRGALAAYAKRPPFC